MVETKEKPDTGSYQWEFDWCTRCRSKTTFWFVSAELTRCAECSLEKPRHKALERDPKSFP